MSDTSEEDSDDFEEVAEHEYLIARHEENKSLEEYTEKMNIPSEGVKITIEDDSINKLKARKKKRFDVEAFFRRQLNYRTRLIQDDIHKTHLLCLLARGIYINNNVLKNEEILALGLSVLPSQKSYPPPHLDLSYLENFIKWFKKAFTLTEDNSAVDRKEDQSVDFMKTAIISQLNSRKVSSVDYLVYIFVVILRALRVQVRLIMSLQPSPLKPPTSMLLRDPDKPGNGKGKRKKANGVKNGETEMIDLASDDDDDKKKMKKLKIDKDAQPGTSTSKTSSSSSKKNIKSEKKKKIVQDKHKSSNTSNSKPGTSGSKSSSKKQVKTEPEIKKGTRVLEKKGNNDSKSETTATRRSSRSATKQPIKIIETKKIKKEVQVKHESSSGSDDNSDFNPEEEVAEDSFDDDSDFDMDKSISSQKKRNVKPPTKSSTSASATKSSSSSTKVSGSSSKGTQNKKTAVVQKKKARQYYDLWAEVYLEEEERWVSIDIMTAKIMCDKNFEAKASPPFAYVLAVGNESQLKDVTRRYASRWLTATQKIRVDQQWWRQALRPFRGIRTILDVEEDELLDQQLLNQNIPTSIQELKSHPMYVLRRHLLKFEAIYPEDPPPLGFIKNEPIYARECVKSLHSREIWMKQAKVVRIGETPYKIVKARPKWNKATSQVIKDLPLELFGEWQVEDYIPPPAVDGKVPRNEYGNVELFMDKMLPKGTVHLKEAGLARVAKKLNIDCAPALTGFEFSGGGSYPVYDGFIVCEEFKDILLDACREDQEMCRKRAQEKTRKRAKANWMKLIRQIIIKRRLERKYDSFNFSDKKTSKRPSTSASTSKSAKRPSTASASKSPKPAKRIRKK